MEQLTAPLELDAPGATARWANRLHDRDVITAKDLAHFALKFYLHHYAKKANIRSMPVKYKTMPCPKCHGTGAVRDDRDVGMEMKARRVEARVSLREMSRRMGFSAPYVSDMEHGRRAWNEERIERYVACLK